MFGNRKPTVEFKLKTHNNQAFPSHTETRQTTVIPPEGAIVVFDNYNGIKAKVEKVKYTLSKYNENEIDVTITCIKQ